MQAVPGQTIASWQTTLSQVAVWHPEHISAYSLIIEEGTDFYKWRKKGKTLSGKEQYGILPSDGTIRLLPDEDEEREIYYFTKEFLERSGYQRYEISNYAIPGYECIHNNGYWKRENYLGLGLNASSMIGNKRWKNTADLYAYLADPANGKEEEHILTGKEQMEEFLFLGLRLSKGISRTDFVNAFHQDIETVYGTVLDDLYEEGLILFQNDNIQLSDKGVDVSNQVLAKFLIEG